MHRKETFIKMPSKISQLNGYGSTIKTIVEVIILVIFVWTFIQVRNLPADYITRAEARVMKIEIKSDIQRIIEPMSQQLSQIYGHLINKENMEGSSD